MKLELLPYRKTFLEPFVQWRHEPSSVRHNPLKRMGMQEIEAMLERESSDISDLQSHDGFRWFICLDGEPVGQMSVKNASHMMRHAEIAYGVAESRQRRGIATAAVGMLVDQVFRESPLRKLLAYVHELNVPSCRVLEKNGFSREGLLREHFLINGKPENEILFGLLRHEWRASPATAGS